MKRTWSAALLCCIVVLSIAYGERITAGSNVFSFPAITAVTTKKTEQQPAFFKQTRHYPSSRTITFSWSLPGASAKQVGEITIYSLLGRVVTKIPVQKNSGSAIWQLPPSQCKSGVYIARINVNGYAKNVKLMLWN